MLRTRAERRVLSFRFLFAFLIPAGMLAFGCSGGDSSPAGTATGGSGGTGNTVGAGGSAGSSVAGGLYQRLGGHMGIRSAVDAIVTEELKDAEIASFFVYQTSATTTLGHPTADQLAECFANQLGKAAGGTETFPGTLSAEHGGYTCRADMIAIHKAFHIADTQFDKFVMIAGTTLAGLGVDPGDVVTIAAVLGATKTSIVDLNAIGGPFQVSHTDAGADAGAGTTTLYQRLGGHTGIRGAVEMMVAAELAEPAIAPYFSAQTAASTPSGHPNADQVEECLVHQLGAASGGPETYPVKLGDDHGSWQCRDMSTIHRGLAINDTTFDKFVMIAASTLSALGVSSTDLVTLGAVLNGTRADIATRGDAGTGDASHL